VLRSLLDESKTVENLTYHFLSPAQGSGKPNLTDSFADALWLFDVYLYYAASNITRAHLHMVSSSSRFPQNLKHSLINPSTSFQGATLASQSANQVNVVGQNGSAGFRFVQFVFASLSSLADRFSSFPTVLTTSDTPSITLSEGLVELTLPNKLRAHFV